MKKTITFLLLLSMLISAFTGCNNSSEKSGENTSANTTDTVSEEANPASDFEYTVNEENSITINKYIGTRIDVVIPEEIDNKSVTQIDSYSFAQNQSLASVKMPNSITVIEGGAFSGCTALTTVVLSQSLVAIKGSAFEDCSKLSNISLPKTLTQIRTRAFANCISLKYISIPKSVVDWEGETFVHSGIETIELEEGLELIGDTAFAYTNIKEVVVPSSIKTISWGAFGSCPNLESVTLAEGLLTIEDLAFSGATKLKEIVFPSTLETVNEGALSNCSSLVTVKFEGNAPSGYAAQPVEARGNYTIFYHEGAEGFTSPEWNSYSTKVW